MQVFKLLKGQDRVKALLRMGVFFNSLSQTRSWSIEVKELRPKRSDAQNRYLWGVCYPAIMKHLEGWEADDIHEYCLGGCFGWEALEGLGRKRLKPLKRSSTLTKTEFMDYVAWIQRHMAEHGIFVPDPNEEAE